MKTFLCRSSRNSAGRGLKELVGHEGRITTLVFSADGKFLVSGGEDTTVVVWDVSRKDATNPKSR
jgi:WD40 repeat protein